MSSLNFKYICVAGILLPCSKNRQNEALFEGEIPEQPVVVRKWSVEKIDNSVEIGRRCCVC